MKILPFGEDAILIDLEIEQAKDRAARTLGLAKTLQTQLPAADVVPAAGTVALLGILARDTASILSIANQWLSKPSPEPEPGRLHQMDVIYDGPDLEEIASKLHVMPEAVIEMHAGREVVAELLGFLPGFAYLGPIHERLVLPRRPSPRPRVAAGSVGIAGEFTGIYPLDSPGGWNLIGRCANTVLFDPARDPPMLLRAGDRVRFVRAAADGADFFPPAPRPPEPISRGDNGIELIAVPPGTTVQDFGRMGCLHLGFPPSGAQDFLSLRRENRALGNPDGAAALEIPAGSFRFRALGRVFVASCGAAPKELHDGEDCSLPPGEGALRYLAIAGGFSVPDVLGSKSTLLGAHFGGFGGRMLKRGDRLFAAPAPSSNSSSILSYSNLKEDAGSPLMLSVTPGPHADRFPEGAMEALVSMEFRVSRLANRIGIRLDGGRIPRDRPDLALPAPMRRGAIQIASDGTPIVLGPDHPVTGGYPVPAMLSSYSQAILCNARPGTPVRFAMA